MKPLQTILLATATADALGVPVEFKPRAYLKENPVTDMQEYGTHYQPKGTWSDDTSLMLCLAESIIEGLDVNHLAQKFVAWKNDNLWTPHGWVFDIGIGTRIAIERLEKGELPELAGGFEEMDNGNGSLMRILPLVLYTKDLDRDERYYWTKKISSLTHAHVRSVMACFYYLEFAKKILDGKEKFQAYSELQIEIYNYFEYRKINPLEIQKFSRLLKEDISKIEENQIKSSGYVIDTLEASIWCILKTNNYKDAVLKAVNLGNDTDTTGAVTGGLAGLIYGLENIPTQWLEVIARKKDIIKLCKSEEDN
ncbi:ADP-ribosylglycohydrolase family protein [Flavobacterium piscinae]|uniref:ADP-ribosylglycohydrolase family protein n=1 Tax=Flavobacterium piscinae TaxID=2506424 RepID=A0A4Q1KP32_9FLAO|nr:ADP-ribosylglycohydrolase family protein [Flavobacterium piscinae]MBC8882620.1 ADP-ribosylglycohydrolase family protein [Flavobacterium piscinae]RXR31325.1 ADP-ribosylglycohydrolase family protein [Flavobacterium piscinae]